MVIGIAVANVDRYRYTRERYLSDDIELQLLSFNQHIA